MEPLHVDRSSEAPNQLGHLGAPSRMEEPEITPGPLWSDDESKNDSKFYGIAAAMAEALTAAGPLTDDLLKRLVNLDVADLKNKMEEAPVDLELPKIEGGPFREFNNTNFRYQPLEGPLAIRILILHPGSPAQSLEGTMLHGVTRIEGPTPGVSITPKKYEAISYVWGSESKPCSILLDGCQMPITQSLFDALVRLRHAHKNRKLWADGICINQGDTKEKATQVALMGEIFTYAAKVLVHLGDQHDGSELMPELLEKMCRLNLREMRERKPRSEDLVALGLPPPYDPLWKALVSLFCRPWFTRIWIVQEVVLARDVRFFCGDWEMPWRLIAGMGERFDYLIPATTQTQMSDERLHAQRGAASVALMHGFQFTRSVVASRLSLLDEDIQSTSPRPVRKGELDKLTQEVAAKRETVIQACKKQSLLFPLIERRILGLDAIRSSETPILKLLGVFSFHEASLPQDRLYALVALAGDVTLEDLPPNYDEHVVDTHARFSRALVKKGQGMDVLYHATNMIFQSLLKKLQSNFVPSWVPDWTTRQATHRHWLKLGWFYSQHSGGFDGRGSSAEFVSLVDGKPGLLQVAGTKLDGFSNSDSIVRLKLGDMELSRFPKAAKKFFEQTQQIMSGDPYFTGERWLQVQCRTLIADHHNRRGKMSSEKSLRTFVEAKLQFIRPPEMPKFNKWSSAWFDLMPDYAACRTSRGFVGLVPEATIANDEIFMLAGSDLPFVLRRDPSSSGYYRFVGGCYMHGLMMGKAWKHVQGQERTLFLY